MTLKTNVLVENICNLSEARYCSGMGVQLLACPVAHVNPTLFAAIKGWVQGPSMILDISESRGEHDVNEYDADFILANTDQLSAIAKASSLPFIVRMSESDLLDSEYLTLHSERIQFVVTNTISLTELEKLNELKHKVLVSIKKHQTNNLADLLSLPIAGLVLTGETEEMPGLKEYHHLSNVLEQLESSED